MMTLEEARIELQAMKDTFEEYEPGGSRCQMALKVALTALRPVSREQVILCKDCMYWQGNNGGYPHPECRWGRDETPDEDDYCSFAERLEVNKNG